MFVLAKKHYLFLLMEEYEGSHILKIHLKILNVPLWIVIVSSTKKRIDSLSWMTKIYIHLNRMKDVRVFTIVRFFIKEVMKYVWRKDDLGFRNELTETLDDFLEFKPRFGYSYINDFDSKTLPLRFPGRTWGYVRIDKNNIVKEIKLEKIRYEFSIYRPEAEKELQKFLGYKIELI